MVAEALPDTLTDSQTDTTVSEQPPVAPSTEETPPPEAGTEPLSPRGDVAEPAIRPVSQLLPQEQVAELASLDEKAKTTGLSAPEYERQRQLTQAVTDRSTAEQRFFSEIEAANITRYNEKATTVNRHWDSLKGMLQELEEAWDTAAPVDWSARKQVADSRFRDLLTSLTDTVNERSLHDLRTHALRVLGDSVQNRRAVYAAASPQELWEQLTPALIDLGRMSGPKPGQRVMSEQDIAKVKRDAVDDYKRANGITTSTSPHISGAAAATGRGYAWYMGLSPEERQKIPPSEEQRIIREEMDRRSGRR